MLIDEFGLLSYHYNIIYLEHDSFQLCLVLNIDYQTIIVEVNSFSNIHIIDLIHWYHAWHDWFVVFGIDLILFLFNPNRICVCECFNKKLNLRSSRDHTILISLKNVFSIIQRILLICFWLFSWNGSVLYVYRWSMPIICICSSLPFLTLQPFFVHLLE